MCVSFQGNIGMFRANQMIRDEAQSADNGTSLLRTVTLYWIIWLAPFGRVGKRSFAVLRRLGRTGHSLHGAPCTQPLPNSLNTPILPWSDTGNDNRNVLYVPECGEPREWAKWDPSLRVAAQMAPCCVARHSIGITKSRSSFLD